ALPPLARAGGAGPGPHAFPPAVLAGVVLAAEFLLIAAIGAAVYARTVFPIEGFEWRYVFADLAVAIAAVTAFQLFDIYTTTAFRTRVHQLSRLGIAWTLAFLVALACAFFIKFEDTISRSWAAGWYI